MFIPWVPLIPNNFDFNFKLIQFPESLCYAMTINKVQDQTLQAAGVDLSTSYFSNGYLCVAPSRVSNARKLYILVPDGCTFNIAYREALL
ncbi:unnamed protein product [Euphydryas editha]|uniref:Uncharacterized protein n=1 Tax=Euphydryas editha TaxID=104508 RepID=A0AAU9TFC5_EUPED|nr:unnamed protein product [Euphydryas editha]